MDHSPTDGIEIAKLIKDKFTENYVSFKEWLDGDLVAAFGIFVEIAWENQLMLKVNVGLLQRF